MRVLSEEASMDIRKQVEKAEKFRELHHRPQMLLLPNAWDVASARILEECGHPAIATSSAAVAYSLGYADGQRISRGEMLEVAGRIARAANIPVTADLEAGYGTTPKEMADTVKAAIAAGIIGMNLEDITGDDESSLVDLPLQMEKIRAIREAASSAGVPFVLNARTDIYLMPIGPEATRFERTVERLRAYREAGADCLFAPGVYDLETIKKLVKAVEAPLNILANPACPSIPEMEKAGVARVSAGSGIMRAAMGLVQRIGKEMLDKRSCELMFVGATPFDDLKQMMARHANEANA
jgi:2-methylisocitrate lyase-like PEP mutase family enzyme